MYVYVYVYIYIYNIHVYICIYIHICIYVYIYIHTVVDISMDILAQSTIYVGLHYGITPNNPGTFGGKLSKCRSTNIKFRSAMTNSSPKIGPKVSWGLSTNKHFTGEAPPRPVRI